MRIAGAARGWLRREQYQGGIGRRPLSRPSSVRGARKVDAFSVALFSLLLAMGQAGLRASAPVPVPVRIWPPDQLPVGHTATSLVVLLA